MNSFGREEKNMNRIYFIMNFKFIILSRKVTYSITLIFKTYNFQTF